MPWDSDMSALLSTQWQDVDATSTLYDVALKLSIDTLPVSISATSSDVSSILSTYVFTQCGQVIGTIDIPKDFLVKSAKLKTVVEPDVPYEGAKPGDKYIDFVINDQSGSAGESHLYIPVNDLVDVYSGGTTDTVSVAISSDNVIYAYVRPSSIISTCIADNAVMSQKIADGQVSMPKLSSDVISFIESISASTAKAIDSKVFIDGISAESLCAVHISQADFYEKVYLSNVLSNELYIVSSDYVNAYGQQIRNVKNPSDLDDAATKGYVDSIISSMPDLLSGLSIEMLSNDYFLSSQISGFSSQISSLSSNISSMSSLMLSNDASLSNAIDSKIFIDTLSAGSLCAFHISQDEFYEKVRLSSFLSNELYIVSSDHVNVYGQQIRNVAEPVDISDAATKGYVDNLISSVPDLLSGLSAEMISNDLFLSSQISALSDSLSNLSSEMLSNDEFLSSQISSLSDDFLSSYEVLSNQISTLSSQTLSDDAFLSAAIDVKVFVDALSVESLCTLHISQAEFYEKARTSAFLSNELYIVSSDFINAYGQQIKNLSGPTDLSDAATKEYVDNLISSVPDLLSELSVEMLSNDAFLSDAISSLSNALSDLSVEVLSNDQFLLNIVSGLSGDMLSCTQSLSSAIDSKVFIDGISAESLCAVHISQADFYEKVYLSNVLSNELYIVSSDYVNAYGQQVKNVGQPVDLSDAATKEYVDARISSVPDLLSGLSIEMLSNDAFLSNQISTVSDNVSALSGSLTAFYLKTQTSSSNEISSALSAQKDWVLDQNYISSIPSTYALKTDVNISYHSNDRAIVLSAGEHTTSVDCNDFIKDGMLSNAYLSGTVLWLEFNTAASDAISIEMSSFVDNYDGRIAELSNDISGLSDAIDERAFISAIPLSTSQLVNDSEYACLSDIPNDLSAFDNSPGYLICSDVSAKMDEITHKVFINDMLSGIQGYSDLSIIKLSAYDYDRLVTNDQTISNGLYIVEDEFEDAYGQQVKNMAPGTDLSDAVNLEQLNNVSSSIPLSVSQLDNDLNFTSCLGTVTGISISGTVAGTSGDIELSAALAQHYYSKQQVDDALCGYVSLSNDSVVSGSITLDSHSLAFIEAGQTSASISSMLSSIKFGSSQDPALVSSLADLIYAKHQVDSLIEGIDIPDDLSAFSNSPGYVISSSISDYCYIKSQTSSAVELSSALSSKAESTALAPDWDASKAYLNGDYVSYNGLLYQCTATNVGQLPDSSPSYWTLVDLTVPDATLDIMQDGRLRVVSADGTPLWIQGYNIASAATASSIALSCEAVNFYKYAQTSASAFSDLCAYSIGDRVIYMSSVYTFISAHEAGAWLSTEVDLDPDSQAFSMPVPPAGKVGDFVLDIDNTANTEVSVIATLNGLSNAFDMYVPAGESLHDILSFNASEQCELYFTMTAFGTAAKPAWKVIKQVVEKEGAGT